MSLCEIRYLGIVNILIVIRSQPDEHVRSVITPVKEVPQGFEDAGYGRIVKFTTPVTLGDITQRVVERLEILDGVSVAAPQLIPAREHPQIQISSVGICAGSGGSLLNGLDVDLLFTGELSHHEALAATEKGKCVLTVFHSRSERGFLAEKMSDDLEQAVDELLSSGQYANTFESWDIRVSSQDKDPYSVVNSANLVEGKW